MPIVTGVEPELVTQKSPVSKIVQGKPAGMTLDPSARKVVISALPGMRGTKPVGRPYPAFDAVVPVGSDQAKRPTVRPPVAVTN